MSLYTVQAGVSLPQASDVNQLVDIFSGKHDIGFFKFALPIGSPSSSLFSLAAQTGSSLGVGAYNYQFSYLTGYYKSDGTFNPTGETLPSSSLSITTTSGTTSVKISANGTFPTSVASIGIYRTSAGGTDYKFVTSVGVNNFPFIDNIADGSRNTSRSPATTNYTGSGVTPFFGLSGMNGWVSYGAPFAYPQYCMDACGWVTLRGVVQGGANGTQITTLPAGYRPGYSMSFSVITNGGFARIDIGTGGAVSLNGSFSSYLFLDGIRFLGEN